MSKYIFPFLLGALVLAVGLIIGLAVGGGGPVEVGGLVHNQQEIFVAGLKAGSSEEEVINSSGYWTGTLSLSSSDSITNAGALTQSGTLTQSGAVVMSGTVHVSQSASSTLQIGNTTSGVNTGCIVLGDSGGATSTPVYITATGSSLSATTTIPAICR